MVTLEVARGAHLGEAVRAVDGPVASRLERHLSLDTALAAGDRVHLAGTVASSAAALGLARLPAVRTALRVGVSLAGEELLVVRRTGERLAAICGGEGSVCVWLGCPDSCSMAQVACA